MSISEVVREWLLAPLYFKLGKLEDTMSKLSDAVADVKKGVSDVKTGVTDFKGDFDAAVKKLQDAVGSGNQAEIDAAVADLATLKTDLEGMVTSVKDLDTTAEGISGVQTPPTTPV